MRNRAAGLLLLALAGLAPAEERFYPVVGPDGRIQMIKGEAETPRESARGAPASAAPAQSAGAPAGPATGASSASAPAEATQAEEDAAGGGKPGRAPAEPAPYDSESYTDVEEIEGAATEAGNPDRFYLIRDGSGQYVTRSRSDAGQASREPVVVAAPPQPFSALPSRLVIDDEVSDDERPEGVPACLPAAELASAQTAGVGTPVTVVVDRKSYAFMGPGRVAGLVRLGEEGIRTLVARSYSAKDRQPAFLDPELFFLDARGCMRRRVSGLYDRRYGPTPKRHSMLRGELLVHGDEEFVLVVAAMRSTMAVADSPFPVSSSGQLSFSIKK